MVNECYYYFLLFTIHSVSLTSTYVLHHFHSSCVTEYKIIRLGLSACGWPIGNHFSVWALWTMNNVIFNFIHIPVFYCLLKVKQLPKHNISTVCVQHQFCVCHSSFNSTIRSSIWNCEHFAWEKLCSISFLFSFCVFPQPKWLSSKPPRTTNGYDLCCWMTYPSHTHKNKRYLMWHFAMVQIYIIMQSVHSSHTQKQSKQQKNSCKQNKWFLFQLLLFTS